MGVEENKKPKILTLKVKEALTKDVGRAIVRIDPVDMKYLGIEVGEIVEVEGKKKTPAKVMPCYREDRGQKIIQMDGVLRENSQIGIDEKVKVSQVEYQFAQKITLSPVNVSYLMKKEKDREYIGSLIEGLPVCSGNKVRAKLFANKNFDFVVEHTIPDGIVVIDPTTIIQVKSKKTQDKKSSISYEDIGGLRNQIQRIREMIELPLKYPEVFEKLGIQAPKGVFLFGPPGTGKTLIARAVAHETDAYFTHISGPEIMGKFYGESEARLRSIFTEAQNHTPAIIFIDEIDAIASKREDMGSEKQVEKRVVAQLLSLLDGLESRGQVIVIAATNIPNSIDPALRRPGRFDREISIDIPDRDGRLEIFQIHTRGMPLSKNIDLKELANITHGFVGADIEALSREAAMVSLRKIMPEIDFEMASIPYKDLMKLEITRDHFLEAMKEVNPSALREVFIEVPEVRWSDIGGLDDIKEELIEAVIWPMKYLDIFKNADISSPKGILLYGPPGTGKTLLGKAVANESGANFISIKCSQLVSRFVGESEKEVSKIFKKAKQSSPCVLFLDEVDSILPKRVSGTSDSHVTERIISQFLMEMDGIEVLRGVVVLAATNRIDLIDPAILRRGRFDLIFKLPLPDEKAREEIIKIHTRNKALDSHIDLSSLAKEAKNMVGSDLEFICKKATMFAVKDYIQSETGKVGKGRKEFMVMKKHFDRAIEYIHNQNRR